MAVIWIAMFPSGLIFEEKNSRTLQMNEVLVEILRNSKGLRLLYDFRLKKNLHYCEGFDTCELGGSRTPNLLIRSQVLYPIKLRVHAFY